MGRIRADPACLAELMNHNACQQEDRAFAMQNDASNQQPTVSSPQVVDRGGAGVADSAASVKVTQGNAPPIDRYSTHYERYNGQIGQGANKTTHTAEIRFDQSLIGLAVVKAFAFADKGWLNEAVAWTLGRSLGLAVPPRAILLVAAPGELASASEPELQVAHATLSPKGPIILWCASRLETKPPQQVLSMSWETVILRGEHGQRLAAFDGWIGNCDRISDNAPYWVTRGLIAAIDHERMAFNQDWIAGAPQDFDRQGDAKTRLLDRLHAAQKANVFKPKQATAIVAAMQGMSELHAVHLANLRAEIEQELLVNVGATAGGNLVTFLEDRATQDFISKRLGVL